MWKEKGLDQFISKHDEGSVKDLELPEGSVALAANMPGSVWKITVKVGDQVKKGDVIVVEESMKMEFAQEAPCDGVIKEIYIQEAQQVAAGQILAAIG
jgi:urea carboxylase